ncbi:hypothetical protein RUM43_012350 [Polyplax serrata]|uniref:Uncharacterized protein n=1 Tax=Polyplax serrata TaxID=468196 RepID=A0AAN8P3K4_POLSC
MQRSRGLIKINIINKSERVKTETEICYEILLVVVVGRRFQNYFLAAATATAAAAAGGGGGEAVTTEPTKTGKKEIVEKNYLQHRQIKLTSESRNKNKTDGNMKKKNEKSAVNNVTLKSDFISCHGGHAKIKEEKQRRLPRFANKRRITQLEPFG